jgi:hypothetical protein
MELENLCEICMSRVRNYGDVYLDIMQKVCKAASKASPISYHEYDSTEEVKKAVYFLERRGYLVSTDIQNYHVRVKPNTYIEGYYNEKTQNYCWCRKSQLC